MYDKDLIQKAVMYHKEKHVYAQANSDHYVVKCWFVNVYKNEPEFKEILDFLQFKENNFLNWWKNLYSTYKRIPYFAKIFDAKITALNLYNYGLSPINKIASPDTCFEDPKIYTLVDVLLSRLLFAFFYLFNGKKMSIDKLDIDYAKLLDAYTNTVVKPMRERRKDYIWSEIPDVKMREAYKINLSEFDTPKNCVEPYEFLKTCFNKFILDTYTDSSEDKITSIGGFDFPEVKLVALSNLIGFKQSQQFKNITTGESREVDFDTFWRNLPKRYAKSARLQQILKTPVNICKINLTEEEKQQVFGLDETLDDDEINISFAKLWFVNFGPKHPNWSQFALNTNFKISESSSHDEFINWWNSNIVPKAFSDLTLQNLLNYLLFDLITVNDFSIKEFYLKQDFVESFKDKIIPDLIKNDLDYIYNRIIDHLSKENLALPPADSTGDSGSSSGTGTTITSFTYNNRKVVSSNYMPLFVSNESIRYVFSKKGKPGPPGPIVPAGDTPLSGTTGGSDAASGTGGTAETAKQEPTTILYYDLGLKKQAPEKPTEKDTEESPTDTGSLVPADTSDTEPETTSADESLSENQQPGTIYVNAAQMKMLTEELFTLIRINEYLKLIQIAKISRNVSDFVGVVGNIANTATSLLTSGLGKSKSRGMF